MLREHGVSFSSTKEDDKDHPMNHSNFPTIVSKFTKDYHNECSTKNPFAWKLISQINMIDAPFKDKNS